MICTSRVYFLIPSNITLMLRGEACLTYLNITFVLPMLTSRSTRDKGTGKQALTPARDPDITNKG